MGALLAVMLLAADGNDAPSYRLTAQLALTASPAELAGIGGGLELDWYPLRFLRLHLSSGAAWMSKNHGNIDDTGALRVLAGADGVLPFTWGEAFCGLDSGVAYSNAEPRLPACNGCLSRYEPDWEWQPAARARAGIEITIVRPFVFGVDVGYVLFARQVREVHWAELQGRVGFAF